MHLVPQSRFFKAPVCSAWMLGRELPTRLGGKTQHHDLALFPFSLGRPLFAPAPTRPPAQRPRTRSLGPVASGSSGQRWLTRWHVAAASVEESADFRFSRLRSLIPLLAIGEAVSRWPDGASGTSASPGLANALVLSASPCVKNSTHHGHATSVCSWRPSYLWASRYRRQSAVGRWPFLAGGGYSRALVWLFRCLPLTSCPCLLVVKRHVTKDRAEFPGI